MMNQIIENQELHVNQVCTDGIKSAEPSGIPNGFDTGYAMAYGVEEAIMIVHFQHFISGNANRNHNFREGRFWTYDRLKDFPNHFPYWTVKQVRRILNSLVKQKVLIKGEFNGCWSDRTQWYAFKDQDHFIKNIKPPKTPLPIPDDLPKRASDKSPNGNLSDAQTGICTIDTNTIPDTITKIQEEENVHVQHAKMLTDFMLDRLSTHNHTYKPATPLPIQKELQKFLQENPHLTPRDIINVFEWALQHHIWKATMYKERNVAKYFCKKFAQLYAQMTSVALEPKGNNNKDRRPKDKYGNTIVSEFEESLF